MEDNEERYQLTEKGIATAKEALRLFEEGHDIVEIEEMLGLGGDDGAEPGMGVRIVVAMADMSGVLD